MAISKIPGKGTQDLFNNISDQGTEGTKVATGTTAQRGSTTGQWRYNTTTGFFEGRNTSGVFSTLEPTPTVTSVDDGEVDSAAGGNQTIVITGTNFTSGAVVTFVGNAGANFDASTTTIDSVTQITAVAPKASFLNAQEPYIVKVTSSSGVAGSSATGLINVDNTPTWSTSAGSLGSIAENATGNHFTVAASDAEGDTVAYSLQSGSLAGLSLNSSTGVISGDPTDVSSDTTNSFTLRATAGSKTVDRAFTYITTNIPTFYDTIVTSQSLNYANRNLGILIDPFDTSSDSGSGSLTNRSGHPVANSSAALNGLNRGGTGTGKYWEATSSDSYIHFGNPTGLTNNTSDAWAYCGWWRPTFEVDDTGQSGVIWVLNDGDWSPASQIGVRFGQGNGFRVNSGSTGSLLNVGIPSATYTNNWVFLAVWHRISGGMYAGQAFATDTNLSDHITHTTYSSSTGSSSGHNLVIGARPDNLSEDVPDGTYIGPQAAWFGGGDSFVSTSESWTEARTQFEAIFDATKGRYA